MPPTKGPQSIVRMSELLMGLGSSMPGALSPMPALGKNGVLALVREGTLPCSFDSLRPPRRRRRAGWRLSGRGLVIDPEEARSAVQAAIAEAAFLDAGAALRTGQAYGARVHRCAISRRAGQQD